MDKQAEAFVEVAELLHRAQKFVVVRMLEDGMRPKGKSHEDDLVIATALLTKAEWKLRAMSGYGGSNG